MNLLNLLISFEPYNFVKYLKYMGLGMLVIFLIIGLIILITALINRLCSPKNKTTTAKTENDGGSEG